MKVTLTAYTPDPVRQMYLAAKRCTTATLDVNEEVDLEEMERVVKNCIKAGHLTVCEFATFNFHIEQITRSCSHQLVRHRHASFCQQSQRRVKIGTEENGEIVEKIYKSEDLFQERIKASRQVLDRFFRGVPDAVYELLEADYVAYWTMIKYGLPVEQARAVLPECTYTNLMMSVNFRELMHIYALRSCRKAEEEIRELVTHMAEVVAEIPADGPFLFGFLKPKCFQCERCSEAKPCGVYTWGK